MRKFFVVPAILLAVLAVVASTASAKPSASPSLLFVKCFSCNNLRHGYTSYYEIGVLNLNQSKTFKNLKITVILDRITISKVFAGDAPIKAGFNKNKMTFNIQSLPFKASYLVTATVSPNSNATGILHNKAIVTFASSQKLVYEFEPIKVER